MPNAKRQRDIATPLAAETLNRNLHVQDLLISKYIDWEINIVVMGAWTPHDKTKTKHVDTFIIGKQKKSN